MYPGPDAIGSIAIWQSFLRVATRSYCLVGLEPTKVMDPYPLADDLGFFYWWMSWYVIICV